MKNNNVSWAVRRYWIMSSMSLVILSGCASTASLKPNLDFRDMFRGTQSPEDVINKKSLNQSNGQAKAYVYDWGPQKNEKSLEVDEPKNYLKSYCDAKEGKFNQIYKSGLQSVKDSWQKKMLNSYSVIKQNTGAFECVQKDGQRWVVSIEPTGEAKRAKDSEIREVRLLSQVMTKAEAQKFYTGKAPATSAPAKPVAAVPVSTTAKTPAKPNETKVTPAKVDEPKEEVKVVEKDAETPAQAQQRLYLAARRDLMKNQNQVAACQSAERAYNYGRVYNPSGPSVYPEVGVLFARCLTTVPAYSKKFANPKGRAKTILQELVNNYNHAVAKHMLQQLK